jgi:hypothetical protein
MGDATLQTCSACHGWQARRRGPHAPLPLAATVAGRDRGPCDPGNEEPLSWRAPRPADANARGPRPGSDDGVRDRRPTDHERRWWFLKLLRPPRPRPRLPGSAGRRIYRLASLLAHQAGEHRRELEEQVGRGGGSLTSRFLASRATWSMNSGSWRGFRSPTVPANADMDRVGKWDRPNRATADMDKAGRELADADGRTTTN